MTTRAFIAIELPEDLSARLAAAQRGLPAGRRVAEEAFHLTLAFLGDLHDAELEELHDALGGLRAAPVTLAVTGLGTFGETPPRSVWARVAPDPGLLALEQATARAVRRSGIRPPARRFVPHVTLARFRGEEGAHPGVAQWIAAHAGLVLPPVTVGAVSLIASTLRPEGPLYEVLQSYPLVG